MKRGLVSAILPELSLEELLAFARDNEFSVVEAMSWPVGEADRKYAGVTHVKANGFTQAQADEILEKMKSRAAFFRVGAVRRGRMGQRGPPQARPL